MKLIILILLSYLLGSLSFGLWISKIFFHKNLRVHGSGNIGATNTFRVLGVPAGSVVLILDSLKGTIATLLPFLFHVDNVNPLIFGLCAVIGHTFPIFANFKGGKAVATSGGILLGYNPLLFLYIIIVFAILLFLSSMVSFASLGVALFTVAIVFISPIFNLPIVPHHDFLLDLIIVILTIFIWIRHQSNLKRILKKTESTISFGLRIFSGKKNKKNV